MSEIVKVRLNNHPHSYKISIGNNLLNDSGAWAAANLSPAVKKIVVVTNAKVFALYGETAVKSLKKQGFEVFVHKIGDGEKFKSFKTLEKTLKYLGENKLKRSDAVIALGGGVVGDLAGFAAAIYLRGIAFLQIPTTLLSMIDSSVGGKTGVNTSFGKNLIGSFHQPNGVLIDVETLKTLPRRELTAGFCEAVKQGAISDKKLFRQTANFLETYNYRNFKKYFPDSGFLENLQKLIAAQVLFKAKIVQGDEHEDLERNDLRSRKILNFGHTVAHALEKVTGYKYFKHGEAVGYGMLVAAEISKSVANFAQDDLKSFNNVVKTTGSLPAADNISVEDTIKAFIFDKKNVGKSLQWILLEEIGKPKIVDSKQIPDSVIKKSVTKILKNTP